MSERIPSLSLPEALEQPNATTQKLWHDADAALRLEGRRLRAITSRTSATHFLTTRSVPGHNINGLNEALKNYRFSVAAEAPLGDKRYKSNMPLYLVAESDKRRQRLHITELDQGLLWLTGTDGNMTVIEEEDTPLITQAIKQEVKGKRIGRQWMARIGLAVLTVTGTEIGLGVHHHIQSVDAAAAAKAKIAKFDHSGFRLPESATIIPDAVDYSLNQPGTATFGQMQPVEALPDYVDEAPVLQKGYVFGESARTETFYAGQVVDVGNFAEFSAEDLRLATNGNPEEVFARLDLNGELYIAVMPGPYESVSVTGQFVHQRPNDTINNQ